MVLSVKIDEDLADKTFFIFGVDRKDSGFGGGCFFHVYAEKKSPPVVREADDLFCFLI